MAYQGVSKQPELEMMTSLSMMSTNDSHDLLREPAYATAC